MIKENDPLKVWSRSKDETKICYQNIITFFNTRLYAIITTSCVTFTTKHHKQFPNQLPTQHMHQTCNSRITGNIPIEITAAVIHKAGCRAVNKTKSCLSFCERGKKKPIRVKFTYKENLYILPKQGANCPNEQKQNLVPQKYLIEEQEETRKIRGNAERFKGLKVTY